MGLHLANLTKLASLIYEILMAESWNWEPLLNSMTRVIVNGRVSFEREFYWPLDVDLCWHLE